MQIIINVPTDQYIVGLINYQPNDIFQFYSLTYNQMLNKY